jgi:phosphatidylserine/phosphatidylglycerophosphate/cardiolipin synthase-like enzyme
MFGKAGSEGRYYYGSNTHRYINELIGRGREVLIVSPYVDRYYAKILLDKSRGRKFYLISSSMDGDALRLLSKGPSLMTPAYLGISLIMLGLLIFMGVPYVLLPTAAIPAAAGAVRNVSRRPSVNLKVPKHFVHAKMYISDGMAITGSANLTYAGTHKNVEQINIIYSNPDISRLREQFWGMWKEA